MIKKQTFSSYRIYVHNFFEITSVIEGMRVDKSSTRGIHENLESFIVNGAVPVGINMSDVYLSP